MMTAAMGVVELNLLRRNRKVFELMNVRIVERLGYRALVLLETYRQNEGIEYLT